MRALTGGEYGFLLLTSSLGNPARKPLTCAQFRELTERVKNMKSRELSRDMEISDFVAIGYSPNQARNILELLQDGEALNWYIMQARKQNCVPITRATASYPAIVRQRLGLDSPGCLWAKGDLSILDTPAVSLVGSRDLMEPNREFAAEVGRQAALQGLTLVSGNARGADKTAQDACLEAGGRVISVVADSLCEHKIQPNVLYLSENGFDEAFSSQRAISRNRVIHTLGRMVFVAQCSLERGGTWDGTTKNLRYGWSPVACYRDGSEAACQLERMGAYLVDRRDLADFGGMPEPEMTLFDR
jgi:predicted Rossmann fold nucleotide-binding protein DprA/Smf involved in DNA uptake